MRHNHKTSRKAEASKSDELLTVSDVAVLDSCSEKTVRRAINAGLLKAFRIGPGQRSIRIYPDDHATYRNGSR
jgi:hypothetical protein